MTSKFIIYNERLKPCVIIVDKILLPTAGEVSDWSIVLHIPFTYKTSSFDLQLDRLSYGRTKHRMGPHGTVWALMGPYGHLWDRKGTVWDRVGSYGTVWAPYGLLLNRMGTYETVWVRVRVPIWSYGPIRCLVRPFNKCPYGPISAHTVPYGV